VIELPKVEKSEKDFLLFLLLFFIPLRHCVKVLSTTEIGLMQEGE